MAKNNILVAFFSRTGNTRMIAALIQEGLGCDIFEIKPVDPYPRDYDATVDRAKLEQDSDFRPELATELENMDSYETIFVGYPNWWGTMPMAVFTFLEKYDLSGKTIVPFCTHEGGRLGRSVKDITALYSRSTLLDALAVRGSAAESSRDEVSEWLLRIGMTEAQSNARLD